LLNFLPEDLYPLLLEQQLFSIMHQTFSISFLSENRERLRHMEGALDRIERKSANLFLALNAHRQEDITEEIEILMLSMISEVNLDPRCHDSVPNNHLATMKDS